MFSNSEQIVGMVYGKTHDLERKWVHAPDFDWLFALVRRDVHKFKVAVGHANRAQQVLSENLGTRPEYWFVTRKLTGALHDCRRVGPLVRVPLKQSCTFCRIAGIAGIFDQTCSKELTSMAKDARISNEIPEESVDLDRTNTQSTTLLPGAAEFLLPPS